MVNPKLQCDGGSGGGMSNVKKVNNNNNKIIIIIIKLLDYYSMMTTLGHWISFYLKRIIASLFYGGTQQELG
jgi:hypothetical protein